MNSHFILPLLLVFGSVSCGKQRAAGPTPSPTVGVDELSAGELDLFNAAHEGQWESKHEGRHDAYVRVIFNSSPQVFILERHRSQVIVAGDVAEARIPVCSYRYTSTDFRIEKKSHWKDAASKFPTTESLSAAKVSVQLLDDSASKKPCRDWLARERAKAGPFFFGFGKIGKNFVTQAGVPLFRSDIEIQ